MFNPLKAELDKLHIVLGTSSTQRQDILRRTKLRFEAISPDFPEDLDPSKYTNEEYVEETAYQKVQSVLNILNSSNMTADIIIGLDTMVLCQDKLFGKPKNDQEAVEAIRELTHCGVPNVVLTGICIKYKDNYFRFTEKTKVYMRTLSEAEILGYVNTGEPKGHAGSYAIQGIAASFIEKIDGDYNNVIGLPLYAITNKLAALVFEN